MSLSRVLFMVDFVFYTVLALMQDFNFIPCPLFSIEVNFSNSFSSPLSRVIGECHTNLCHPLIFYSCSWIHGVFLFLCCMVLAFCCIRH